MGGIATVSYTHLDVYKRQVLPYRELGVADDEYARIREILGLSLIHI